MVIPSRRRVCCRGAAAEERAQGSRPAIYGLLYLERHLWVDSLGLLLALLVTDSDVHDSRGG